MVSTPSTRWLTSLQTLKKFDFNVTRQEVLGKPTLNVDTVEGGMNINSVPDQARIGIDIRTVPGQSHDSVRVGLESYLGKEVQVDTLVDLEGIWTNLKDI